jgi:NNP family nitrate/nitrite transporter-like MFS transporter
MARALRIMDWNPEDTVAWEAGNNGIARRNLVCTVIADHVAFSVWSIWSVLAWFMPQSLYGFSAGDKLLLGAVATFVGGCVRIPYTLGIAKFGGRNWTVFSALALLIPALGTVVLLANPGLPLWTFVMCAALTGLGGGNYAASLANVNAFYPQRLKGWALGVNAGFGNLGVAGVQVVGLLVLAFAGNRQPYWVCALYLVLLAVVAIVASLFMDNLDHSMEVGHIRSILSVPDTWVITLLYTCAFGSWIGFAFAFGQVLHVNFEAGGQSPGQASLHTAQIAFLGPLLGSLSRVVGGKISDRVGGGRVTLTVFAGMILAAGLLVGLSSYDDHAHGAAQDYGPPQTATLVGYVVGFIALFILSGVGNGSVFKLIPSVFEARSRSLDADEAERRHWARTRSGALIGFAATVGALGGVGINLTLRESYAATGSETSAYWIFLASYAVAMALTWKMYVRRPTSAPAVPEVPPEATRLDAGPVRV